VLPLLVYGNHLRVAAHLSAVSPAWRTGQASAPLNWPGNAMRARGNEGVVGRIKVSEGSIGYVEYHSPSALGFRWSTFKTGREQWAGGAARNLR
jgi:hypothetical protein